MQINNIYIMIELLASYRREMSSIVSRVENGERGEDLALIANHILHNSKMVADMLSDYFNFVLDVTEEYVAASKLALAEIGMIEKLQDKLIDLVNVKEECPA